MAASGPPFAGHCEERSDVAIAAAVDARILRQCTPEFRWARGGTVRTSCHGRQEMRGVRQSMQSGFRAVPLDCFRR